MGLGGGVGGCGEHFCVGGERSFVVAHGGLDADDGFVEDGGIGGLLEGGLEAVEGYVQLVLLLGVEALLVGGGESGLRVESQV